ncbi:type IV pilus modification protein PilV [Pseudomonas subflava]|uniref:type IV pilus modification protein PilV n=1 Tax=Pseudomonas subflava TaxID=2952933 RepID=UPI00257BB1D1|nr:type IV pilus modification protein PilV [Pseudomonas subflava]
MRRINGFSLIEILMALLLTTIGILGMVALQGRSIQYTQDSVQRNTAVELSNDLIEIIRANPKELFTSTLPKSPMNSGMKDNSLFFKNKNEEFENKDECVSNSGEIPSTPLELRDCWAKRVEDQLPGGAELLISDMYICRSAAPGQCTPNQGSMMEIKLAWRVREGACLDADTPNSTVCTYTVRVQP